MVRIVSNQLEETEVFVMNNTQTLQVKVTLPSLGYMMIAETTRSNVKLLDYSNVPQVKNMVS
jgi:hypothetical protein